MTDKDRSTRRTRGGGSDWTGLSPVVRPTLIVAIGGTGSSAAKAARERITTLAGERRHFIAFRAFDTAYQDNQEPRFVDNAEYVYLGGFNAQAVISDIVRGDAYPHWERWLPPRLNFQQVAFGAGGIRPIGRLCYFYRRDRVEAAVQEALTTITDADLALRFHQQTGVRVNLEAGIDIHVVCSVCGGTGSGMFLDMAFDLRRWAEDHTDREVTVTGHLVLPEAFRNKPVVLKALEANAYVALQELDRYMNASSDDPWTVEHVEGRPEQSWRAPFDHCYLLSGLQQGGTSNIETLSSVIGETMTLLTVTQVGQRVSDGVINMAGQRKSTRDERGRLCCYSSYGVLGLEIPWGFLGESLGPELAKAVRKRLAASRVRTGEDLEVMVERFREALELNPERPDQLVPQPQLDKTAVLTMIDDMGARSALPRSELQRELLRARGHLQQELQQREEEDLWPEAEVLDHLQRRLEAALLSPQGAGLDAALRYLTGCTDLLNGLRAKLRATSAEEDAKAQQLRPVRQILEQGDLAGREWDKQLWPEVAQWEEQVRAEARHRIYAAQARKLDILIDLVEQRLIAAWRTIQNRFQNLRLDPPRDEDSYYRDHRALASICPLDYFRRLVEPAKDDLIRQVMEDLVEESHRWAELSPRALVERFNLLCTRAIRKHFEDEARIECDALLADYYDRPSRDYDTEVNVFLKRAEANWELHESYALRNNRLEISGIGATADSMLHESLNRHNHHISAVEEQRKDYVPILRSEHGISLIGLKRLEAYRDSLVESIVQEQRYDLHFFLDRRWITRREFSDEGPRESEQLCLFSIAEMLERIKRQGGKGYVWSGKDGASGRPLGRYRREAFQAFRQSADLQKDMAEAVATAEQHHTWHHRVLDHVDGLKKRVHSKAFADRAGDNSTAAPRFLSLDIYQIHSEIRALRDSLYTEEMGI